MSVTEQLLQITNVVYRKSDKKKVIINLQAKFNLVEDL